MPEFLHGVQNSEKVYDRQGQSDRKTGKRNDMKHLLPFVATVEKLLPIATQGGLQMHQCRQTRKVFSCFEALNVARTCANFFGQLFLRQFSPTSQRDDVFSETCSIRTAFWFAHRHCQILSKMCPAKHEALHRAPFFLIMETQRASEHFRF